MVRLGGGPLDGLLARRPGIAAGGTARRAVAAADREPGLHARIPDRRSWAPAALHREHRYADPAAARQTRSAHVRACRTALGHRAYRQSARSAAVRNAD